MCGEKLPFKALTPAFLGSPPHVRGKACCITRPRTTRRITPACAGKRGHEVRTKWGNQDHPRMCGEKNNWQFSCTIDAGSPPHVRGKAAELPDTFICAGITPACAGKRFVVPFHRVREKDHPRMCGEKFITGCPYILWKGSPPHVRGKGDPLWVLAGALGITPACAGKRFLHR